MKTLTRIFGPCLLIGGLSATHLVQADVVDVLVLYTPEAAASRNGKDIDARIASYIAYANTAYKNSQVDIQLRLVGSQLADLPYDYVTETNLNNFQQDSSVARLRKEKGADLVTLLNLRQQVSNGYVCGIGYISGGDSSTGRLYQYSSAVAYSLVGIDCGVSTFAHELGHNMGLGHSYAQGSKGGVWEWARGHGVSGLFSTVMAYPQSYGTNNQLPVFSNPEVQTCSGLPCGMEKELVSGADAATSLNALATQIAAFMPMMTPSTEIPAEPVPVPDQPKPLCPISVLNTNAIPNGDFNSLDGWRSGFGQSALEVVALDKPDCSESVLRVTDRVAYYSSAAVDLTTPIMSGKNYRFKAQLAIENGSRETIRIALRVTTSSGAYYSYLNSVSATSTEFTQFKQDFSFNSGTIDSLIIYGPAAGVNVLVDNVSLAEL